ncbi:translation initiation factor IF-2 [Allomyces macrogynus ATCC 38327]|uniref:Translation initiation factor IF-2, chloroplastic n=1 Tax=Allomyces macrogynus (strain ATCC 38327) TaxID=578462 RepID=A0A0L0S5Z6_ALLM3|nr:translation initiation factor IF-2 [Allomyces macrogynus ATCC 38327]|eukprot:KNE57880.1 translation initiation factor IF-2 [Allomyces macrogynus ATCC 38327]
MSALQLLRRLRHVAPVRVFSTQFRAYSGGDFWDNVDAQSGTNKGTSSTKDDGTNAAPRGKRSSTYDRRPGWGTGGPRAPRDPNAPFTPRAPRDPNAPFVPRAPRDPNAPFVPRQPRDQGQLGGGFAPRAPRDPNQPFVPRAPRDQSQFGGSFAPRAPRDPNAPFTPRTPRDPNAPFTPRGDNFQRRSPPPTGYNDIMSRAQELGERTWQQGGPRRGPRAAAPAPAASEPAAAAPASAVEPTDHMLDVDADLDLVAEVAKPSRAGRNHYHPHETFHHQKSVDAKHRAPIDPEVAAAMRKEEEEALSKRGSGHIHRAEFKDKVSRFRAGRDEDEEFDEDDVDEVVVPRGGPMPASLAPLKQRKKRKPGRVTQPAKVQLPEAITVANLSQMLVVPVGVLQRQVKSLLELDFEVASDYVLNAEMATLVANEVAPRVEIVAPNVTAEDDIMPRRLPLAPEEYAKLPLRAPVVTIMGHVDHGKTTLLDTLRKSAVAASEAGGITQHIGAFEVALPGGKITFLDTPGHAAFENMRARGANVTDIVVLVVAADDGVMPQTREAIKHAHAADVPIIVAINKCDKPGIDKERIKNQLLEHDVQIEELGGDTMAVEISALKGTGLDDLEESILTLAEIQELRADPTGPVEGMTLESQVKKGRGSTATVLVKEGTLRIGDILVAGTSWCRVKSMATDAGVQLQEAPPATPVEVLGWRELPAAGERVVQVDSEDAAKKAIAARERRMARAKAVSAIDEINAARIKAAAAAAELAKVKRKNRAAALRAQGTDRGDGPAVTPVAVIVKGDVSGSVEAVVDALAKIDHPELNVTVSASGVGAITESDVERTYAATTAIVGAGAEGRAASGMASAGLVVGFNVKPDKKAAALAKRHKVTVVSSNVIYKLMDNVKEHLATLLAPETKEEVVGEATIAQIFDLNVKGSATEKVAGCKVTTGVLAKANQARIVRAGKVVFEGPLKTIKHFKREVHEISKGNECGLMFDEFEDFKEGDVIQSIKTFQVKRTLE